MYTGVIMHKSRWVGDETNVRLSMPFFKVDTERRIVSGFASLDNVDTANDVVTAEASREAFAKFRGNVREMHSEHLAVGRVVNFKEDVYFDKETNKFYQGIYVDVYVSKGAQDTWEKVLDGTLNGFSIGGAILESDPVYDPVNDRTLRMVTKYMLTELSLVDNPANQLANVLSFQKVLSFKKAADGGESVEGIAVDVLPKTIFYCESEGIAKTSTAEDLDCTVCGDPMVNLGWFESTEGSEKEIIKMAIAKHTAETDRKGGATENMPEEVKKSEEVQEPVVEAPAEEVTEVEETEVEETVVEPTEVDQPAEDAEDVDEVVEEDDELTKIIKEFQSKVEKSLETTRQQSEEQVEELRKGLSSLDEKIEERVNGLNEKLTALEQRHSEFEKKFETVSEEVGGIKKSIDDAVAADEETALKKSADIDPSADSAPKKSNKPSWGGSFINVGSLG